MKNPSLHKRAGHVLLMLSLAVSAISTAACDDPVSRGESLVTTASPVSAAATISLGPVGLVPLSGFGCSGFVFGSSFNVIVVSSGLDLTVDSMTLHMIDGTNLGGPSVTIPTPQLARQFGSTVVRAGSTRVFGLRPVFPCVGRQPHSLTATAVLMDQRRVQRTLTATAAVR